MATNYPGSLDNWSNPTSSTSLSASGLEHDVVHANAYDAIEAIETELGTHPSGSYSTLSARLDNRDPTIVSWGRSGTYIWGHAGLQRSSGSVLGTASLYYTSFYAYRTITPAALVVEVFAAAPASNTLRMGIYSSTRTNTGLVPSSLIVDAGTVATDSTGYKELSISQELTGGTWYFFAVHTSTNTQITCANDDNGVSFLTATNVEYGGTATMFTQSRSYSTLPTTPSGLSRTSISAGAVGIKV